MAPAPDGGQVHMLQGASIMRLGRFVAAPLAALAMGAMLLAPHSAFADQRDFTLVNQTGRTITNAYVSSSANTNWGHDVLGRDVLLPGRSTDIEFSGGSRAQCFYDI